MTYDLIIKKATNLRLDVVFVGGEIRDVDGVIVLRQSRQSAPEHESPKLVLRVDGGELADDQLQRMRKRTYDKEDGWGFSCSGFEREPVARRMAEVSVAADAGESIW